MASLTFSYSAMGAGKSIELLKIAHNYEKQGKTVLVLTSALDNRTGVGKISSRIGLEIDAIAISPEENITDLIERVCEGAYPECILIDEVQFFSENQIMDLACIVDYNNIPIMCFGLKNDFQNQLFEGSEALLRYADKLVEIKTVCYYCTRKAHMNLRLRNGKPIYEGAQVQIGDSEYQPVCRYHYHKPKLT